MPVSLGPNIGMFRPRKVHDILRPRTPQEVQTLVTTVGDAPLHPYSTGRNWGLGSREPAQDDVIALDLSGLDAIRGLNVEDGWAVVEPGVTQARLARRLDGTDRILNLTASSAHTSIVGNILDRGVGLRRPRVEDLLGVEVVLPDGELVHVGWWPDSAGPAYAPGLGPSLLHAFVQSSLGIVTAAAVRLLPRPEALRVISLQFDPESLAPAVDLFRRWVSQGLAHNCLRVYDPAAAAAYRGHPGQYLAHVCVDGAARAVDALRGIIIDEANECGLFSAIRHADTPDLSPAERRIATLVESEYAGTPDPDDVLLTAKTGHPVDTMDAQAGLLFFLPVIPFSGRAAGQARSLVQRAADETGTRCAATYFTLDSDLALVVIAIRFTREPAEAGHAHRTLDRLYELFTAAGFAPGRLDVDHAHWVADTPARRLVRRLKDTIDPNRVIAPGRYQ
ncbi:FAD-binding oxidoreductase [Krasilnikovia sp. MM14-A1004]|uniref:FAD-binding oxidoreductase n=1 Tax=Krasilnikovia sp. MM14-A1004 TaxID=3373541 RepID=UPI00399C6E00